LRRVQRCRRWASLRSAPTCLTRRRLPGDAGLTQVGAEPNAKPNIAAMGSSGGGRCPPSPRSGSSGLEPPPAAQKRSVSLLRSAATCVSVCRRLLRQRRAEGAPRATKSSPQTPNRKPQSTNHRRQNAAYLRLSARDSGLCAQASMLGGGPGDACAGDAVCSARASRSSDSPNTSAQAV